MINPCKNTDYVPASFKRKDDDMLFVVNPDGKTYSMANGKSYEYSQHRKIPFSYFDNNKDLFEVNGWVLERNLGEKYTAEMRELANKERDKKFKDIRDKL
jgi:hypothetical protein